MGHRRIQRAAFQTRLETDATNAKPTLLLAKSARVSFGQLFKLNLYSNYITMIFMPFYAFILRDEDCSPYCGSRRQINPTPQERVARGVGDNQTPDDNTVQNMK